MKIQFHINLEYKQEALPKLKDAEVKTNAIQILKQSGVDDVKSL